MEHFGCFYWVYLCRMLLCFVLLANSKAEKEPLQGIINGVKVKTGSGKWPFIAAIKRPNQATVGCGGSVLNQDTILTAAHCLKGKDPNNFIVYLGNENLQNMKPEYIFYPDKFIIHRHYNLLGNLENDIGVIKLKNQINIKNLTNVEWACLPNSEDDPKVDTKNCYVIGWGYDENNELPNDLFQLELPILGHEVCKNNAWYIEKYMMCAGYLEGGKDACSGDSGGPLVCSLVSNPKLYSLRGLVSFGTKCAEINNPGYYTRVTTYLNWIKTHALD